MSDETRENSESAGAQPGVPAETAEAPATAPAAPIKPAPAVTPKPAVAAAPRPPAAAAPPKPAATVAPKAASAAASTSAAPAWPPKDAVVTAGTVTKAKEAAAPPKPAGPPAPKVQQPAAPSGPQPLNITRRTFFSSLGLAWVAFSGATGAALTATARFMFPNVLFEPPMSFKAGYPSDYAVGMVDERWKEKFGTWIVRDDEGLYALSTTCTHLGCTPNWLPAENKFKCPCHGSGFYPTGINFEGPAPRPLERYKIALADDGQIVIDKNQKYQQEKGQWSDPSSFIRFTG